MEWAGENGQAQTRVSCREETLLRNVPASNAHSLRSRNSTAIMKTTDAK